MILTIYAISTLISVVILYFGLKYIKRDKKVVEFRLYVLAKHPKLFPLLPPYEEMLVDGKELIIENYFDGEVER